MMASARALLVLLLSAHGMTAPAEDNCDQSIPDKCLLNVMFLGNKNLDIPHDDRMLEAFCADVSKSEDCGKSYLERCTKSLTKQVATMTLNSVMATVHKWCGPGKEEFLGHARCMYPQKPEMDKCMVDLIRLYETIIESVPADDIIPQACCSFSIFSDCIVSTGQDVCPQDTVDYLDVMVQAYSSELLDMACANYQSDSERCGSLPPLPPLTNSTLPHTLLPPIMNMMDLL